MIAVLSVVAAVIVAAALFVIRLKYELRRANTPTTGERIDISMRPNLALLVIDIQKDFTSIGGKYGWDEAYLKSRLAMISTATVKASEAEIPVIAIRHVYRAPLIRLMIWLFGERRGIPGSKGLGLALPLSPDFEVVKSLSDGFSSPELEGYLAANRVGTLLLTGLDGCHCVQNTANGALNRGYRVEILENAVLSRDEAGWRKHAEALEGRGAVLT
ncbi:MULTISPECIES: cysteine hydrolase [unclassified Sinorhizobium]|uniref:cysteine hydrolase n=1 Tax=unclassified Sinorhizobium TaxID=2613772 RepID=UPI0024C2D863|nr:MULTISPECIES: cysteine hydrolase [unclassified Sinorhizobium]MDK1375887.1 cysteine hydrolase [Sinorhizobium sp. 6-70]MDK1481188.1 cysteine hydrolase [Sinorhizobium sp. 6-117]